MSSSNTTMVGEPTTTVMKIPPLTPKPLTETGPLTQPTEVILDLKQDYGLDISYRVVWLGVEKSKGELFGAHSISFNQLCWYNHAKLEHNPGSYINIECDDLTQWFIRYFISFKPCIDGFNHCRPLLFLDATFLKGRFKGFLLATTANDENQVFTQKVEQFHKSRRIVASEFLANTPLEHWANAFFRRRCYGEMCPNATESFNSWVREARNLPITRMIDNIKVKIMRQMAKHRVASHNWTGSIYPKMESRLENAFNKGRSWKVSQSNDAVYEAHSFLSVAVDIGQRTCSCFQWQLNEFPCAHAMVAVWKSGRDLNSLIEPYFHVSKYRSTYAPSISPITIVE
ncbi:hypothetical protein ACSBR2_025325 [Camellia fascicularis]